MHDEGIEQERRGMIPYLTRPESKPDGAKRAKGVEYRRPSIIMDKQRGECEACY